VTPDALAAIHKAAFPHDPWSRADLAGYMSDPAALLVARPEGFILLRIVLDEAEVLTFAVAPQAQGRGMGPHFWRRRLRKPNRAGLGAYSWKLRLTMRPPARFMPARGFARRVCAKVTTRAPAPRRSMR